MRIERVLGRKVRVACLLVGEASKVFREQGAVAAVRFGTSVIQAIFRERLNTSKPSGINPMDKEFGTDTTENVKLHGLDISSPNYRYGIYYRATDFPILREVLGRLTIQHEDYTFIDYGSGKGLVLLQAAAYPFKKVIGVEFARELHDTACRNVERYPAHLRIAEIELVHGDAVEFRPPEGNLVVYLYEPFEAPVTRKMIARIDDLRRTRNVILAYVWSENRMVSSKPLWDAAPFLKRISEGAGWTIYRGTPESGPRPVNASNPPP